MFRFSRFSRGLDPGALGQRGVQFGPDYHAEADKVEEYVKLNNGIIAEAKK